jgi:hypothetical protein
MELATAPAVPQNLFVPKARGTGCPLRSKPGNMIKPPPPAIASTNPANNPKNAIINNSKVIREHSPAKPQSRPEASPRMHFSSAATHNKNPLAIFRSKRNHSLTKRTRPIPIDLLLKKNH